MSVKGPVQTHYHEGSPSRFNSSLFIELYHEPIWNYYISNNAFVL